MGQKGAKWSREYPKEPGWYWWRKNKHSPSRILELEAFGTTKVLCERHYGCSLQEWGGEWGLKIPNPVELTAVMGVLEAAAAWLYNFNDTDEKRESDLVAAIENLPDYEEKP